MRMRLLLTGGRETTVDVGRLAQAGATAIAGSLATDLWKQVKGRVASLFSAGDSKREREAISELEELSRAWVKVDESGRSELVAELRGQLKERLRRNPQLAEQFAALVAEVADRLEQHTPAAPTIRQSATAGRDVIQGGRDVTIGKPRSSD